MRSIQVSAPDQQPELIRLYEWAKTLEREGLCRLYTSVGKDRWILNPRLLDEDATPVSIYNEKVGSLSLFRTVLQRRAPALVSQIETLIAPIPLGRGNAVRSPSSDLLLAIETAYREAAGVAPRAQQG